MAPRKTAMKAKAPMRKNTKANAMKAKKSAMKAKKPAMKTSMKAARKPAMKAMKKSVAMKAAMKKQVAMKKHAPMKRASASGARPKVAPKVLENMHAFIVNLERRPDRAERVSSMLRKETPWLKFEMFPASDGTKNPIPEEDITNVWNSHRNSFFADYFEWVYDAPGSEMDGKFWKWAADTCAEDTEEGYRFAEDSAEEWSYIHDAPTIDQKPQRTATVEKIASGEKFKVKLQFQTRQREPGEEMRMSGGERGCAHSHLRLWKVAAERSEPTLVLEDDVHLTFDRNGEKKGKMNGKVFTDRLALAMRHVPTDFDVVYLGWSGWRGGHFKLWAAESETLPLECRQYIRKAEYVWTTVAYVISQAGAKKLLAAAGPINQPVDNFMAWEASQGRLNSYVAVDEADEDGTWAGGIVDQFDFQGDSDIKKSDGGHQGDDAKEFVVEPGTADAQ